MQAQALIPVNAAPDSCGARARGGARVEAYRREIGWRAKRDQLLLVDWETVYPPVATFLAVARQLR